MLFDSLIGFTNVLKKQIILILPVWKILFYCFICCSIIFLFLFLNLNIIRTITYDVI